MLLWLLPLAGLACGGCSPPADPGIGPGSWRLEGDSTLGQLILEEGRCEVGFWGVTDDGRAAWGTGGPALRPCEVESELPGADAPGAWIYFPFRTGAGDGAAAGRLDPTEPTLTVPLSNHPAEGALTLTRTPGTLSEAERVARAAASEAAVLALQAGWAKGEGALMDGDRLVGEIYLGEQASVAVYDEYWMTDGVVDATWRQDGAVMLLQFPVMPALQGEEGLLRVNPVTGEARVPLGSTPTDNDRRLRVALRGVSAEEASAAISAARESSIAREQAIAGGLAQQLAAEAMSDAGACRSPETLPGGWPVWLAGYEVRVARVTGESGTPVCEVVMEPDPIQHGRRMSIRARPDGVIEQVVRSLE